MKPKYLKQVFTFAAMLVIIFALLSQSASADNTDVKAINEIRITGVTIPATHEKPKTDGITAKLYASENEKLSVEAEAKWYKERGGTSYDEMQNDDEFTQGLSYRIDMSFELPENCKVSDSTKYYNDGKRVRAFIDEESERITVSYYYDNIGNAAKTYTVEFEVNMDGRVSVAKQTIESRNYLMVPDIPEISGFVFCGWYTDSAFTTAYDFESRVSRDMILYGKWEAVISRVDLYVGDVYESKTPTTVPEVTTIQGAQYKVSKVHWVKDAAGVDEYSEALAANNSYYCCIHITASRGSAFAAAGSRSVYINNREEHTYNDESIESFSVIYPITIKPIEHKHELEVHDRVPPTCTEDGMAAYWECTECGKIYSDGNALYETKLSELVLTKLDHDYGEWTVKVSATCTATGLKEKVCKNNSSHFETEVIPELGHNYGAWNTTRSATCVVEGMETRVCGKDSTHTETRTTGKSECKWSSWQILKAATQTEKGSMIRSCSVCGRTEVCEIPAQSVSASNTHRHSLRFINAVEATCTRDGNISYYFCNECRQSFEDAAATKSVASTSVKSTGHSFGEWNVEKEATASEEGERSRLCTKCGMKQTDKADKTTGAGGQAYTFTSGSEFVWESDGVENAVLESSALKKSLIGVYVDGKAVPPVNYINKSGDTKLEIKSKYLNTLDVGEHELEVRVVGGAAATTFTVKDKSAAPAVTTTPAPSAAPNSTAVSQGSQTAEPEAVNKSVSGIAVLAVISLAALIALAVFVLIRKGAFENKPRVNSEAIEAESEVGYEYENDE